METEADEFSTLTLNISRAFKIDYLTKYISESYKALLLGLHLILF